MTLLLEKVAHFNDLSDKLREELETRVRGFGKSVRYKFDIGNPNPDPEKTNGAIIYPQAFTLDPTRFTIKDPHDNKIKQIALVEETDEKGLPNRFKKIKVLGRDKGYYTVDLTVPENMYIAMFLELHPKLSNGQFADPQKRQLITRIDEGAFAKSERKQRTDKLKALNAVADMDYDALKLFADAMQWDSNEDEEILRNKVEQLAETQPVYLTDLVTSKKVEYLAIVKQAREKNVVEFDPAEFKFKWAGNQQVITILSPASQKSENELFAEWLQIGGKQANETYKKLKELVK